MPNQPVNVTFWLDPKVKAEADALFSEMGLTLNTAVSMFVRQSIRDGGFPFRLSDRPHVVTAAAHRFFRVIREIREELIKLV